MHQRVLLSRIDARGEQTMHRVGTWKRVVAIVVVTSFVGSMVITQYNKGIYRSGLNVQQTRASPIHALIIINNEAEMVSFPDKTGNGTEGNPYVIQNFQINAGGWGSCIEIRNVINFYVTIKDCTVNNSGINIPNDDSGIELFQCKNIKIINCTILNNQMGISAIYSSLITIESNQVYDNAYHGILLENTDHSIVRGNNIYSNDQHGLVLDVSNNNTITYNTCTSNGMGGILLRAYSSENTIYLNYFGLNIIFQAGDDGTYNTWDSPIGNRYGDYETVYKDATNDGILWDTPYELFGSSFSVDTRPVYNVTGSHGTIRITSNAAMDAFCSGNGTNGSSWATAHHIRNYKISAGGGDYCIQLQNVDRYVIIEKCVLITAYLDQWGSAGVKVEGCKNVRVTNCTLKYNTVGIQALMNNQHCKFDNNVVASNSYAGIYVMASSNLTIFNNTVKRNYVNGIHQWSNCKDNNITSNNLTDNRINGLLLQNEQNTTVEGNWITGNYLGTQILYSDNITIKNNHVVNSTNMGISILGSPGDITLDSNQITTAGYVGVSLDTSIGVTMVSNKMTNTSVIMEGSLSQLTSASIDTSNEVNGKTLYYYHDQNGLSSSDFVNAGQIIAVNCNSSVISNINCSSGAMGIIVYYCKNVTLSSSTLTQFTSAGLFVKASTNCTLTGNILVDCYQGVMIENCTEIGLTSNAFVNGGLVIATITTSQCETLDIDTSNTVNGRLICYYVSRNGLVESDFSNAGQIILINCNNSRTSSQNVSHGSNGIYSYRSYNNSFVSIDAHANHKMGALIQYTENLTFTGGNFSGCDTGIKIRDAINCTIAGGTFNECNWGLFLSRCFNSTAVYNSMSDCKEVGACISEVTRLKFENNTVSFSDFDGIYLTLSSYCHLNSNDISNNNRSGIISYNGKWNTIFQNNLTSNGNGIILAQNTSHNALYFNSFINNSESSAFYDLDYSGTNNTWSNGTEGNYWDDYQSRYPGATNLGRTWSIPYALNGSTTAVDPHPLVYPWRKNINPDATFMVALSTTILTTDFVQFIFTGNHGNLPCTYQWSFGDGTINVTSQHPLHAFNTPGNYTITLTVTDADRQYSVLSRVDYISVYTKNGDFDGDELTNNQEINTYSTDLTKWDTDGDGMSDGYEVRNGLNPLLADGNGDLDSDGLTNLQESLIGTRADLADTDGDGFSDKVEVDWKTDPTVAFSSPLTIILFPTAAVAAIVFIFLGARVINRKKKSKTKIPSYSRGDWTDEELIQDSVHIEEKIDEKRAILSRVMEPMTSDEGAASQEVPDTLSTVGKKKGKGSGQEEVVTHKVDEQTESEVGVIKKKEFCIVCNTSLKATVYVCPHCETKYCIRCAIALSERKEPCWTCRNPMNFSP